MPIPARRCLPPCGNAQNPASHARLSDCVRTPPAERQHGVRRASEFRPAGAPSHLSPPPPERSRIRCESRRGPGQRSSRGGSRRRSRDRRPPGRSRPLVSRPPAGAVHSRPRERRSAAGSRLGGGRPRHAGSPRSRTDRFCRPRDGRGCRGLRVPPPPPAHSRGQCGSEGSAFGAARPSPARRRHRERTRSRQRGEACHRLQRGGLAGT